MVFMVMFGEKGDKVQTFFGFLNFFEVNWEKVK